MTTTCVQMSRADWLRVAADLVATNPEIAESIRRRCGNFSVQPGEGDLGFRFPDDQYYVISASTRRLAIPVSFWG